MTERRFWALFGVVIPLSVTLTWWGYLMSRPMRIVDASGVTVTSSVRYNWGNDPMVVQEGRVPSGFPVDLLPVYPGATVVRGAGPFAEGDSLATYRVQIFVPREIAVREIAWFYETNLLENVSPEAKLWSWPPSWWSIEAVNSMKGFRCAVHINPGEVGSTVLLSYHLTSVPPKEE